MTTVSVVIPAYNAHPDDLKRAVDSVRAQTHRNWELVVVDDGSDQPVSIDGVTVIRQENGGVSAARNRGVGAVSGDYLAFLDQDDYWHSEKLARQLVFMRQHDLAMCDTDFDIVRRGETVAHGYEYHEGDFCRLLSTARIGLSTLVVRRDTFERVAGFNPLFLISPDWEFQLRVAHAGYKFDRLREVLCTYHLHGKNASSDYRAAYREQTAIIDLYEALDRRPAVRDAARSGRRRMRQLYALQAIDAFRSSRGATHLVWATQTAPRVVARSVLTKFVKQ